MKLSTRKIGGLRFISVGRHRVSYCRTRPHSEPRQPSTVVARVHNVAWPWWGDGLLAIVATLGGAYLALLFA